MNKVEIKKALETYKESKRQQMAFMNDAELNEIARRGTEEADAEVFEIASKRYPDLEKVNDNALHLIEVVMKESPKHVRQSEIARAYYKSHQIVKMCANIAEKLVHS